MQETLDNSPDISGPSLRDRLISGGTWAFGARILGMLAGIGANALLARLLDPDELGTYFLSLSMVSLGVIVAGMGLPQAVIRLVAESMGTDRPGRARRSVILVLALAGMGIMLPVIFMISGGWQWISMRFFHSDHMAMLIYPAAAWLTFLTIQGIIVEVLRGFHDLKYASIFGGFSTPFISCMIFSSLWLIKDHIDLNSALTAAVISSVLTTFMAIILLAGHIRKLPSGREEDVTPGHILSISWPIWVTAILVAMTQADIWILGIFRPKHEVAVYGAAARLMFLVTFPLLIVNAVVPPVIAEMYARKQRKELEKILRKTATIAAMPALAALIVCAVSGKQILGLIYGDYYAMGGTVLICLSAGQFVNVWAGSCAMTLMLTGFQRTMMFITMVSGTVTVAGSITMAKFYGAVGVACAAASGLMIQSLLMLFFSKRHAGIWTHADISMIKDMPDLIKNYIKKIKTGR